MENIKRLITENKLILQGETIGVGVSGGKDSMALLHKLHELSRELNFEIVAITVDHSIRDNAKADAQFVMDYCQNNNIRAYKFKIERAKLFIISLLGAFMIISRTNVGGSVLLSASILVNAFNSPSFGKSPNNSK